MTRETILIVDDSHQTSEILKDILAPMEYNVLTAYNGRDGLESAIRLKPDLIFLDMNMPIMNGLEMLAALRRTECKTPVIFMTVEGSEQVAVEALRLGVRDYIPKPFTVDEIQQAVDRALREARLEREHETLNRSLLTAEAVRSTLITLSHYFNNYLTALNGDLQLLDESMRQDWPDPESLKLLEDSRKNSASIGAVLRILLRATSVKLTPYTHATPMIDIQKALDSELRQMRSKQK